METPEAFNHLLYVSNTVNKLHVYHDVWKFVLWEEKREGGVGLASDNFTL